ncbi:hypothetical protein EYF80_060606 [Liparis tanakae]|uniref:Uncharacterized protein n=1 Tax=Liparis tanakae TaxID=230148 RepID=A0A4Z2EK57_9TELE|nr:hypothetical protein EYF80_060606 [Liparis tanakae]
METTHPDVSSPGLQDEQVLVSRSLDLKFIFLGGRFKARLLKFVRLHSSRSLEILAHSALYYPGHFNLLETQYGHCHVYILCFLCIFSISIEYFYCVLCFIFHLFY